VLAWELQLVESWWGHRRVDNLEQATEPRRVALWVAKLVLPLALHWGQKTREQKRELWKGQSLVLEW
jgi:hypothetical protein